MCREFLQLNDKNKRPNTEDSNKCFSEDLQMTHEHMKRCDDIIGHHKRKSKPLRGLRDESSQMKQGFEGWRGTGDPGASWAGLQNDAATGWQLHRIATWSSESSRYSAKDPKQGLQEMLAGPCPQQRCPPQPEGGTCPDARRQGGGANRDPTPRRGVIRRVKERDSDTGRGIGDPGKHHAEW